jgi:hypothetical protein
MTGYGARSLILRSKKAGSPQFTLPLLAIFGLQLIYETAVATLALAHIIPPSSLTCGLDAKWEELWKRKDEHAIKTIQDVFNCCGRHTVVDRAWPFGLNSPSSCPQLLNRTKSCFEPWRRAEQIYASLILLVAIAVFFLKARITI